VQATRRIDFGGNLCVLAALLCWCSVPLFIEYFTGFFDQFTQNGLRYTIAASLWLPVLLWMLARGRVPSEIWAAAVIPSVVNVGAQTFWAWSLYYLEPGMVAFGAKLNTVWGAALAILLFADERRLVYSVSFWIGMALSAGGFLVMVAWHGQLRLPGTVTGLALIVTCSVFWALYAIAVRWKVGRFSPIPAFAVISLYTAAGCDLLMVIFGRPADIFEASGFVMSLVAASAVLGIGLAHVFYYAALKRLGVAITSGILLLSPFITAVLSRFIYSERLSAMQWTGGAILVLGTGFLMAAQQALRPETAGKS